MAAEILGEVADTLRRIARDLEDGRLGEAYLGPRGVLISENINSEVVKATLAEYHKAFIESIGKGDMIDPPASEVSTDTVNELRRAVFTLTNNLQAVKEEHERIAVELYETAGKIRAARTASPD